MIVSDINEWAVDPTICEQQCVNTEENHILVLASKIMKWTRKEFSKVISVILISYNLASK